MDFFRRRQNDPDLFSLILVYTFSIIIIIGLIYVPNQKTVTLSGTNIYGDTSTNSVQEKQESVSSKVGNLYQKYGMTDIRDIDFNELKDILVERKKNFPYIESDELLNGLVHKQISKAIVKRSDGTAKSIASIAKNFEIKITGTTGFNYAQVTKGGVSAYEIDDKTMRSTKCDNLYIVGELIDVDGDCGGYNLQWAYSSAMTAVDDILSRIRG